MARVGLNGVWGIHLAPKAVCLFNARRQHPPKNDKFNFFAANCSVFLTALSISPLTGKLNLFRK
jgi:hypothetical protein